MNWLGVLTGKAAEKLSVCLETEIEEMNFAGPLEDRLAIRELLETFSGALTREDKSLLAACWADDGVWITPQGEQEGKEAIVRSWANYTDSYRKSVGVIYRATFYQPIAIHINGDSATGLTLFTVVTQTDQSDATNVFVGSYGDEYTKIGGKWLFKTREYESVDKLRVREENWRRD